MRPTTSSRATTWSRGVHEGTLGPQLANGHHGGGGGGAGRQGRQDDGEGQVQPQHAPGQTNTAAEASRDSATVTTTTRRPFFFRVENWKNSPVLKAMKARATSGRKSMPSITV